MSSAASTPPLPSPPLPFPSLPQPPAVSATYDEKKKHVIMEMFETEKSFVKVLELIAEVRTVW